MTRGAARCAVGIALVGLAACKDPAAAAARDAGAGSPRMMQVAPPGRVVMAEPKLDLPQLEAFELLAPGTGARSTLRYHLAAGARSFVRETALSERHLDDHGAFTPPVQVPAIHEGFAVTVAADAPGRLALRPLVGEAAAASPEAEAMLDAWRRLLQNRRVTVTVDDRGQLAAARFNDDPSNDHSEAARLELVERLLAATVPLPAEPVAVGARWRVVTIFKQGPAAAKQTATYTLVARAAVWKIHVKLQRVAEQQRLAAPGLPAGATADLVAMFRMLEGDVVVDPTLPLIAEGTLTTESRMHLQVTLPGKAAAERIFEGTGRVTFEP